MRTILILQARMLSDRLPGKILKPLLGRPMMSYEIENLLKLRGVDQLVVATGTCKADDAVERFCEESGITCFRGSDNDVLDRFIQAARKHQADVVIRACADCPLMDHHIAQLVVDFFNEHYPKYEYVSNVLERSYPRGMDLEIMTLQALERAQRRATTRAEKEHVTYYVYSHPDEFSLGSVKGPHDLSYHRWTVDTQEDFALIEKIMDTLEKRHLPRTMQHILELFEAHPQWLLMNRHIKQKPVI